MLNLSNLSSITQTSTSFLYGNPERALDAADPNWKMVGTGDFDGDGQLDILWYYPAANVGQIAIWYMDGNRFRYSRVVVDANGIQFFQPDPNWTVVGTGYFGGLTDKKVDILWRHTNGDVAIWHMDNATYLSGQLVANAASPWKTKGSGDFDRDGHTDSVHWNPSTGEVVVWFMNGGQYANRNEYVNDGSGHHVTASINWELVGTGHFDLLDNKIDLLWRDNSYDGVAIWRLNDPNGLLYVSSPRPPNRPVAWKVGGTGDSRVDSDGDTMPDLLERNVFGTLSQTASGDHDGDGLLNSREVELANNVLISSPTQDHETGQNTQSETTVLGFGNTVIVAYADSNLGVAGYGQEDCSCATAFPPPPCWEPPAVAKFIGWSVSGSGVSSFVDKGSGLQAFAGKGNGGDPILARDSTSGKIYLTGNSARPGTFYNSTSAKYELYLPVWTSSDNGQNFSVPLNGTPGLPSSKQTDSNNAADIDYADKPAMVVDNFPNTGQG